MKAFIAALFAWMLFVCSTSAFAAAPTIGSQDFLRASGSSMTLTLANVDSGAGILVIILQNASAGRTYTVSDSVNGSGYLEKTDATSTSCDGVSGTQRCTKFYFLASSLSTASMTITITQSSTAQGFAAYGLEINCSLTCQYDTGSKAINTGQVLHHSSASSTVIDTATDVFVVSACTGNQSGTITKETGFDALLTEGVNDNPSMAEYKSSAPALNDERGDFTSGSSGNTECGIVSIKNAAAVSGGSPKLLLLGVG